MKSEWQVIKYCEKLVGEKKYMWMIPATKTIDKHKGTRLGILVENILTVKACK